MGDAEGGTLPSLQKIDLTKYGKYSRTLSVVVKLQNMAYIRLLKRKLHLFAE